MATIYKTFPKTLIENSGIENLDELKKCFDGTEELQTKFWDIVSRVSIKLINHLKNVIVKPGLESQHAQWRH